MRLAARVGRAPARARLILALACASLAPALAGQAIEIASSEGYAEALVPSSGWRQAVVGRQLPEGSVLTTWIGARATMDYQGNSLELGSLGRLKIEALEPESVRLTLTEGSLTIRAASSAFEVEYRGARISVREGEIALSDGVLSVVEGKASVEGYSAAPLEIVAGGRLALLDRATGPVFKGDRRR